MMFMVLAGLQSSSSVSTMVIHAPRGCATSIHLHVSCFRFVYLSVFLIIWYRLNAPDADGARAVLWYEEARTGRVLEVSRKGAHRRPNSQGCRSLCRVYALVLVSGTREQTDYGDHCWFSSRGDQETWGVTQPRSCSTDKNVRAAELFELAAGLLLHEHVDAFPIPSYLFTHR